MEIICYKDQYKDEIISLILNIQNREAGIHLPLEEQPDLTDIKTAYIKDGGCFWLALNEQDEIVGTIAVMKKEGGFGILKKFFVRADYRSQKVGFQLYLTLLDFCNQHNITSLLLDTPSVAKASHRFYEKNGFVKIQREDLPIPYDFPDRDSYLYFKQIL